MQLEPQDERRVHGIFAYADYLQKQIRVCDEELQAAVERCKRFELEHVYFAEFQGAADVVPKSKALEGLAEARATIYSRSALRDRLLERQAEIQPALEEMRMLIAGPPRGRVVRVSTPKGATRAITVASFIAGRSYPWAASAWLAEIAVSSDGLERPVSSRKQLLLALEIAFVTAPKMRLRKLWWQIESVAMRLGRWCLFYDPATGTILGAAHVALVELLKEEVGFYSAVGIATILVLLAVEWIRRMRRVKDRGE